MLKMTFNTPKRDYENLNVASDLVRRKVDVILTFGDFAPRVVREATSRPLLS